MAAKFRRDDLRTNAVEAGYNFAHKMNMAIDIRSAVFNKEELGRNVDASIWEEICEEALQECERVVDAVLAMDDKRKTKKV